MRILAAVEISVVGERVITVVDMMSFALGIHPPYGELHITRDKDNESKAFGKDEKHIITLGKHELWCYNSISISNMQ